VAWTQQFNVMLLHYSAGPTNDTSALAGAAEADGTIISAPLIQYNYVLARGNQSYIGSHNGSGQVASAATYCGHQESGFFTGPRRLSNNILDYSGAFFPYNTTRGTCSADFTSIADFNAGTGNFCSAAACN
jgi:hypothetical protein